MLRQHGLTGGSRCVDSRGGHAAALLLCMAAALLAGCNATIVDPGQTHPQPVPNPPPGPPPVTGHGGSLTITPQYAALAPGQSLQFTVHGAGSAQTEWLVNGVAGGSATTGTVDSNGNYTAPASVTPERKRHRNRGADRVAAAELRHGGGVDHSRRRRLRAHFSSEIRRWRSTRSISPLRERWMSNSARPPAMD